MILGVFFVLFWYNIVLLSRSSVILESVVRAHKLVAGWLQVEAVEVRSRRLKSGWKKVNLS